MVGRVKRILSHFCNLTAVSIPILSTFHVLKGMISCLYYLPKLGEMVLYLIALVDIEIASYLR